MTQVDVTRIAGNIAALNALNSLQNINSQLATHQARLATGKRLMEAADDPAGMNIATTFDVRRQGMQTALSAIGDGKNLLANDEGGLKKVQDILVKMRNKALEATADTLGTSERAAIQSQLRAFRDEIADVVNQAQWNGNKLLGDASGSAGGTSASRSFLVDADGGTASFSFAAGTNIVDSQGFAPIGASGSAASATGLGLNDAVLTITDSATAGSAMSSITTALNIVKEGVSQVGAFTARLTFKEEALTVAHANTEAAYNRIMNANMAEEQVQASKLLILQQTATAMLAQANAAPQFLLSLFR
ncbi:MAG: flagellin [Chloroflexi bacterium]|nr:flagellin [Chloroflexota bacterium]